MLSVLEEYENVVLTLTYPLKAGFHMPHVSFVFFALIDTKKIRIVFFDY